MDQAPYELRYEAAPTCTSEAEVRAEVAANVHDPAKGKGVTVALEIKGAAGAYAGVLVVIDRNGRSGKRELSAPTCAEVGHALAFLAGLAIDLGGHFDDAPPAAPPPPPTAPPPPPPPPPPPVRATVISLTATEGFRGGMGPTLQGAFELGVGVGAQRLGYEPTLRALLVASAAHLSNPLGSIELLLAAARLDGCPVWLGTRSVGVRPCIGFEAGAAFARSNVGPQPRNPVDPWAALDASLHLEWRPTTRFFVDLSGALVVPLVRTLYYFDVLSRELYRVPPITARFGVGVGVRFP